MGIRIHPLNLSESDYAGECFIESRLALTFMKFRMLFMIMLFVLAPMSGCLSSADEESTKADSIVNGSNSLIKMTDESPGENCAYGGVKIETGIDLDGNEKVYDAVKVSPCFSNDNLLVYSGGEGEVVIEIEAFQDEMYTVIIYDGLGKQIGASSVFSATEGGNKFTVQNADLAFGNYLITLRSDSKVISQKLILR